MTQSPAPTPAPLDAVALASLQLIADSAAAITGFRLAVISLTEDDGHQQVVAVGGSAAGTAPAREQHGMFSAPLVDGRGRLRGTLVLDLPADGQRPDESRRAVLERYAAHAGRAVITALERDRLAREVRLAEAQRAAFRETIRYSSAEETLPSVARELIARLELAETWITVLAGPHAGQEFLYRASGHDDKIDPAARPLALTAAEQLWAEQDVLVIGHEENHNLTTAEGRRRVEGYLERDRINSLLLVPIGAGSRCLGAFAVGRPLGGAAWSRAEMTMLRDLGHDLGNALANHEALGREQAVAAELRALDRDRSQMLRTVAHELKNPLTAILSNVELLRESPDSPDETTVAHAVRRIDRGVDRMTRILGDLAAFGTVGPPEGSAATQVDLAAIVLEVTSLSERIAEQRQQVLWREVPEEQVQVYGVAEELHRVVTNLVSNALKYTEPGGRIGVLLERRDDVVLTVTDTGIGISAEDQRHLFEEFFRSADPRAGARPGTGLGLAIVERIAHRHGGRIEVESQPGAGSTFRVILPGEPS